MLRALSRAPLSPRFAENTAGSAAVEFVLWLAVLIVPVLSAVDVGVYAFQRMQVQIAGQAAAQTAWHLCDTAAKLPAVTTTCGGTLLTAMSNAAKSTSLGTGATLTATSEGWYCPDATNKLKLVGTAGTFGAGPTPPSPLDCHTVVGAHTNVPGDYIKVTVSYSYAPLFRGLSVGSLLTTPITQTTWLRLN
jgi:Flp pilus assembly protein TadG